jgi:hypothetical protein
LDVDLREGILVTVSQADKAVVYSDSDEDRDKQDREDDDK